jgi:DNA-binding NarL/FixJ family response regulator
VPRVRVLLAEDHDRVADQLRRLLEIECDVVGVVSDGQSLVSAVDMLSPEVIVSDVTMPLLDGLAAAQVILSRHRDARIVFVTVNDDPLVVRKALLIGAFGYVLKTDASGELLTAVRAAQARQPHLSANLRSRSI